MKTPKLIPLNMKKANGHNHPDINTEKTYLCLIDGSYFAGKFNRQWYGWNFLGWYNPVGLQFDAPGTNHSRWEMIWEIVE